MPHERKFPPRSVLVVDHDKDSAESLAAPLRYMGSDVEVAHDGPSALAVQRTFRPDIVLIDLGLPGMDAYTVARFLRAQPQRDVPLVAVAGSLRAKDRRRAKEAGFSYRLRKPVDLAALQSMFVALGVAEETAADAARQAVALYKRGIITEHEFVLRVLESGAQHDPAEMADLIPRELLDAVRQAAESPPAEVSDVLRDYRNSLLSAEQIQAKRESTFNGLWRWFRFFHAGFPEGSPHCFATDIDSDTAPAEGADTPYIPRGKELALLTALPPRRILVVNDYQPQTEELATRLRKAGHTVEIGCDQHSVLELERTFGPEMVIIELGLSEMDAHAIARSLRAQTNRDLILVSTGEPRDPRAQRDCFDDHMNEYAGGTLFLMRRRKRLTEQAPAKDYVAHLLRLVKHQTASFADEQFVICMLAAAVCPSSSAELAPLIPDEFLRRIRAFAESPTDLANYLVGYKEKVFAEGEYWEDVLKGASLWFRFFNP